MVTIYTTSFVYIILRMTKLYIGCKKTSILYYFFNMSGDPAYNPLHDIKITVNCCELQSHYNQYCTQCGQKNPNHRIPAYRLTGTCGFLPLRRQSSKMSCSRCFEPAERSSDLFCGRCAGEVNYRGLIEYMKNGGRL